MKKKKIINTAFTVAAVAASGFLPAHSADYTIDDAVNLNNALSGNSFEDSTSTVIDTLNEGDRVIFGGTLSDFPLILRQLQLLLIT